MSRVHLEACADYDPARVSAGVRACLTALPEVAGLLKPGARILLKPNIINAKPPETAICTHPAVIRAVAEACLEAGCEVLVADEPGYALTTDPDAIFRGAGMLDMLRELPVRYDLLKRGGFRQVPVPNPLRLKQVTLASQVLGADVVINLPKCKTHSLTLLTGAVKNMFGAVAPKERIDIHMVGTFEGMAQAVADCYSACIPALNIMDGIVGMEGKGPSRGTPRPLGFVAASTDGVALDAVVEGLTGFAPGEVKATVYAAQKGCGECDLGCIELSGADPAALRCALKRAPGGLKREFPRWLGVLMRRLIWVRPVVDPKRCVRCGACEGICPGSAITIDKCARIDYRRCLECFCCQEVCPAEAIDSRSSWLARQVVSSDHTRAAMRHK